MKKIVCCVLAVLCASSMLFAAGGQEAEAAAMTDEGDWRAQYPEITLSEISSENEADRIARVEPFIAYLEKELGVKVKFHVTSDYAGTIEGMKAKKVQLARFGSKSYAEAWIVTHGNVEPLVVGVDNYDSTGYHSVIVVLNDSPYKSVDDLKGKNFGFADPNSTSGFLVPTFFLRKAGKDPDEFFGTTGFSGSHENGVLALKKGTFDAVPTWWNNDSYNNLSRMAGKGMINIDDYRIVWKSPLIPSGPYACLADLPQEMKDDLRQALLDLPKKDPELFKAYTSGGSKGYIAVKHERWQDIIDMRNAELEQRKAK